MHLYYREYGSASFPKLIILHGLLGSSDNWHSLGKIFGERFHTFIPDARNHGRSPHSEVFNYQAMAGDIKEFTLQRNIYSVSLLGHSMGGKTAALVALLHPDLVERLIVVDIAPRAYRAHHDVVFDALISLDLNAFDSRKGIDDVLSEKIFKVSVRQFLMKNLTRDESGKFRWKMNLDVIQKNYTHINEELPQDLRYHKPTLFIRGENSNYIQNEDVSLINKLFPQCKLVTINNASHWVHTEATEDFVKTVLDFLSF